MRWIYTNFSKTLHSDFYVSIDLIEFHLSYTFEQKSFKFERERQFGTLFVFITLKLQHYFAAENDYEMRRSWLICFANNVQTFFRIFYATNEASFFTPLSFILLC